MATYNPFENFNPVFTKYEYLKVEDPLYGEIDIPSEFDGISPDGTWIAKSNIPSETTTEKEEVFGKDIQDRMASTHADINNASSNYTWDKSSRKITTEQQKENAIYIMDNLINKNGFKPHEAAGMVGNLMAESRLNTGSLNSNDLGLPAGGLAGWRGSNFSKLKQFAKNRGKSWTDIDSQLDFLVSSIDSSVRDKLSRSTNPHEASEAWAYYEKYAGYDGTTKTAKKAGWSQERVNLEHKNRSDYANEIYELWKSRKS